MTHLLKRLELNGFKSFAGRTVFDFSAGITAIVGPNGSGKSNVVDALRWLLGEREAKNLRGAKVEDLIFAGTAKRPRLGQAQASLHFNNKNKFFPLDFAEVTVARQIARDGVSRYFLNKSEILLRDLIDFFAKARLGSRGLIVVTQGNSDVFIRVSPRERREMMEEILGLREYQLKKTDAERRLKNSEVNLDKAKALMEEILPHLRSLNRQTNKWGKRGELEDKLKELENRFFGHHFGDVRTKLDSLEKNLEIKRLEFQALEQERRTAEEKQKQLESSQPEERGELLKIREAVRGLIEKRGVLDKELGRLEARIEMEAEKPAATAHSVAELLHLLRNVRDALRDALKKPPVELETAVRSSLEGIEKLLGGRAAGQKGGLPADVKAQLQKINKDTADIGREIETLRVEENKLEKSQESFYETFKKAVAAVEAAKDKIEKWHEANRELLFGKERLALRREELVRQITQLGRRVGDFEHFEASADVFSTTELGEMERRIFKLRGDLAAIGEIDEALLKEAKDTESRYEFLTKESKDLEKAVKDLKELIGGLKEKIREEFAEALLRINQEFKKFFDLMFGGGHARLKLMKKEISGVVKQEEAAMTEGEKVEPKTGEEIEDDEGGVEINLKLPRKKINTLDALSGGERSLVGIAALFAMISVSPPPFLVLDEIDAALDDRNARRFADLLKEFAKKTQFVVVTHNRATMEAADVLYGVTLNDDGTSKVLSLKLE